MGWYWEHLLWLVGEQGWDQGERTYGVRLWAGAVAEAMQRLADLRNQLQSCKADHLPHYPSSNS